VRANCQTSPPTPPTAASCRAAARRSQPKVGRVSTFRPRRADCCYGAIAPRLAKMLWRIARPRPGCDSLRTQGQVRASNKSARALGSPTSHAATTARLISGNANPRHRAIGPAGQHFPQAANNPPLASTESRCARRFRRPPGALASRHLIRPGHLMLEHPASRAIRNDLRTLLVGILHPSPADPATQTGNIASVLAHCDRAGDLVVACASPPRRGGPSRLRSASSPHLPRAPLRAKTGGGRRDNDGAASSAPSRAD